MTRARMTVTFDAIIPDNLSINEFTVECEENGEALNHAIESADAYTVEGVIIGLDRDAK